MKKLNIITLFFLITKTLFVYSQNDLVRVNYFLEFAGIKNSETLLANKSFAKYVNEPLVYYNEDNVTTNEDTKSYQITQKVVKLDKIETFQKVNTTKIQQTQYKENNKKVNIIDSLPNFNWVIDANEIKEILGQKCLKATCNFRGTEIVAYFTQEIPISFGPWKFGKLPGLILEIYTQNSTLKYHWYASEIVFPYKTKEEIILDEEVFLNPISMKDYMKQMDIEIKEKNQIIDSRSPSNSKISSTKTSRLSIEKIFEWE